VQSDGGHVLYIKIKGLSVYPRAYHIFRFFSFKLNKSYPFLPKILICDEFSGTLDVHREI